MILIEPGAVATPIWQKSLKEANALLETLPPQVETLYGPTIEAIKRTVDKTAAGAVPAERVATAVKRALTDRRPKTRVVIGTDAKIQRWIARLPDRMRDKLLYDFLGIKG